MTKIENMFSFNKGNIEKLITGLGYSISKPNHIIEENGVVQHCIICNHDITKNNLGMVIPGSKLLLCDNPACFSKYLAVRTEFSYCNANDK